MSYSNLPIGVKNPGLVVILVDQSSSMVNRFTPTLNRAEFAALAVNRCIYEILANCRSGTVVRDRCHVAVIGYGGQGKSLLVAGKPSEMESLIKRVEVIPQKVPDGAGGLVNIDFQMPIWVEAAASGGTPMNEGFSFAKDLINAWITENPTSFPPICINITDGEPNNEPEAEAEAARLRQCSTSDGQTLLFNAHIGNPADGEVTVPSSDGQLSDNLARFLFRISSEIPASMVGAARNVGFNPQPGSRGMIMNAGAEALTKLIQFGSQAPGGGLQ